MPPPPCLTSELLANAKVGHGFYGRRGGVSTGVFQSLNCGQFSGDDAAAVATNRQRVAAAIGVRHLFSNQQVHGNAVRVITADTDPATVFPGDGLVTCEVGLGLGVLAADCAPVLFADCAVPVIGVAHAGWKGALAGVTDGVIARMVDLGADPARLVCAIGPTIQRASYAVGAELVQRFQTESPIPWAGCFHQDEDDAYYFDLPHYLNMRIARAGVQWVDILPADTFADEDQFFSYRRSCHRQETDYGRQISALVLVA